MTNFHTFTLGSFTCTSLVDFARERTPRETFPKIDPAELQAEFDEGGYNLDIDTPMSLYGVVLLVDTGEKKILFDAGLPTAMGGGLLQSLEASGHAPNNIDYLVVTHGDFDHIGGLANFPKTQIVMPSHAYALWTEDTEGMVEEFMKLMGDGMSEEELTAQAAGRRAYKDVLTALKDQGRLNFVECGQEIVPGIRIIDAQGHRRDHVAVEIESEGKVLLHIVDAFRHEVQLKRHDFYSLFDSYPETLAKTMVMLLNRAVERDALVFGAHLHFPALFRIGKSAEGYQLRTEPVSKQG